MAEKDRNEDLNGGIGETRQQRPQKQICGVAKMVVFGGGKQRPTPEKQNMCNCGRDDGMMRTVGRGDTKKI